jgi:hypothetical protein
MYLYRMQIKWDYKKKYQDYNGSTQQTCLIVFANGVIPNTLLLIQNSDVIYFYTKGQWSHK